MSVELLIVKATCLWCTAVHVPVVAKFAVIAVGSALTPATGTTARTGHR